MNERQHDMTGAWALNALDTEERAQLEEYLAQDPIAAEEARSFEETAGELARGLHPERPRPELKSSLMGQISQTRQLPPLPAEADTTAEVTPLERHRRDGRATRWLAVAAAALLLTTITGFGLWSAERTAQQDAQQTIAAMNSAQAAEEHEQRMVSTIMAAEDMTTMSLPAQEGGGLNLMYSQDQQAMIIRSADLPVLPSGSTYQLWLMDDEGAHSAGFLTGPDQTVMVDGDMVSAAQVGLSVEPVGGSEQPTEVIADGAL